MIVGAILAHSINSWRRELEWVLVTTGENWVGKDSPVIWKTRGVLGNSRFQQVCFPFKRLIRVDESRHGNECLSDSHG